MLSLRFLAIFLASVKIFTSHGVGLKCNGTLVGYAHILYYCRTKHMLHVGHHYGVYACSWLAGLMFSFLLTYTKSVLHWENVVLHVSMSRF